MIHRCQICGRRQKLRADGTIFGHYRFGMVCAGSGRVAEGQGTLAIEHELARLAILDRKFSQRFTDDRDRRSNEPLPVHFWERWRDTTKEISRLRARLKRLEKQASARTDGQDPARSPIG